MNRDKINQLITQHLSSNYELSPNASSLYIENNEVRIWTIELTRTNPDGTSDNLRPFSLQYNLSDIKDIPVESQFIRVLSIVKDNLNGEANPTEGFF